MREWTEKEMERAERKKKTMTWKRKQGKKRSREVKKTNNKLNKKKTQNRRELSAVSLR